jgi:hypothetical protein
MPNWDFIYGNVTRVCDTNVWSHAESCCTEMTSEAISFEHHAFRAFGTLMSFKGVDVLEHSKRDVNQHLKLYALT